MAPLRARAGYFRLYGAGRTTVLPSIVTAPATRQRPTVHYRAAHQRD